MPVVHPLDGVALQRDSLHTTPFAAAVNTGNIVLTTDDLDFPLKAGGQFLIGHTINAWNRIEFSYMVSEHWSDSEFVRDETVNNQGGFGNLFSPFTQFGNPPVLGLDFNNLISIEQVSTFQTAELNWRHYLDMPPGRLTVSTLLGVRCMEIREHFGYHSVSDVPAPQGSQNTVVTDTGNYLLGVQIGATMEFYVEGPWWVNFEIKGAMCENRAAESTDFQHIDQNGNPTEYLNHRDHVGTSWIGDIAATVVYRFSPRASARFGYQALFVEDVALANVNALQDINFQSVSVLGPGRAPPELQHGLSRAVRRTPTGLVTPGGGNRGRSAAGSFHPRDGGDVTLGHVEQPAAGSAADRLREDQPGAEVQGDVLVAAAAELALDRRQSVAPFGPDQTPIEGEEFAGEFGLGGLEFHLKPLHVALDGGGLAFVLLPVLVGLGAGLGHGGLGGGDRGAGLVELLHHLQGLVGQDAVGHLVGGNLVLQRLILGVRLGLQQLVPPPLDRRLAGLQTQLLGVAADPQGLEPGAGVLQLLLRPIEVRLVGLGDPRAAVQTLLEVP